MSSFNKLSEEEKQEIRRVISQIRKHKEHFYENMGKLLNFEREMFGTDHQEQQALEVELFLEPESKGSLLEYFELLQSYGIDKSNERTDQE